MAGLRFRWLLAAALYSAGRAQASPPVLEWSGPPECPERAEVVRQVEQLLGQPLTTDRPQAISLEAAVQKTETGYVVQITALTAQGRSERHIAHRNCRELADASALVMALAIDPELFARQSPAPPPSEQPVPPAIPAPATQPPASAAPPVFSQAPTLPPRTRRWQVTTATAVRLGWGVLSDLDAALGAELGLGMSRWRLVATGYYWWPRQLGVPRYPSSRVNARLLSAGIKACLLPKTRDWRLLVCAGGEMGDLASEGVKLTKGGSEVHRRWGALLGELGGEWPLGRRLALSPALAAGYVAEQHPVQVRVDGAWLDVVAPEPWLLTLTLSLRVMID